jgi:trans-aconitate 2-methyltransferase
MDWDPRQYEQFAAERRRPFTDLLARVGAEAPRHVVDLGCGTGSTTTLLAQRWPGAQVEGIDSSPEMIAAAPASSRVTFRVGDVAQWQPGPSTDVIVSSATLQWVPGHRALLSRWAAALPVGGWLAVQVPGNFASPSHTLMRALAASPQWSRSLGGVLRHEDAVAAPVEYAALLQDAGLEVDVWETTYVHLLPGPDPVLAWVRGTALRPVLAALPTADYAEFEAEFAAQLREAYPATEHGTPFPFRRIFAAAHRPSATS